MEDLRWIGFGTFFVVSLVIGLRLLLLARRTGEVPELLIGLAVLGIGPLGYGLSMLAFVTAGPYTIMSATLQGSAFVAIFVGSAAQCLFVWYVFRRRAVWARPLVYTAITFLAVAYTFDILESGLVNRGYDGFQPTWEVHSAPINANGSLGSWATLNSMPTRVYGHAMTAADGYLYASGGNAARGGIRTSVYAAPLSGGGAIGSPSTSQSYSASAAGRSTWSTPVERVAMSRSRGIAAITCSVIAQ